MVTVSILENLRHALKYRGGWRGLWQHMYTVRMRTPYAVVVALRFFSRCIGSIGSVLRLSLGPVCLLSRNSCFLFVVVIIIF